MVSRVVYPSRVLTVELPVIYWIMSHLGNLNLFHFLAKNTIKPFMRAFLILKKSFDAVLDNFINILERS